MKWEVGAMNKMFIDFTGVWKVKINDESFEVKIPGTLDECGIGGKDELLLKKEGREFVKAEGPITSRFTRKTFYMGKAVYRTWVSREAAEQIGDRRAFFTVERSRALKLYVDGKEINALSGTLSTPYRFEITGLLKEGSIIELACDNSYPISCILQQLQTRPRPIGTDYWVRSVLMYCLNLSSPE